MGKRLTTKDFITRAKDTHGDKYDYSLTDYTTAKIKITIICPIHGSFKQLPHNHIKGSECPICSKNSERKTISDFILKANITHNNFYNYDKSKYINAHTKIKIICPIHGVFSQIPKDHLKGCGCPKCSNCSKLNTDEFIKRAIQTHGTRFDYSMVVYTNIDTPVIIICPTHGEFKQSPYSHIKGCGCQLCSSSKGELQISKYLLDHNIHFTTQHRFKDCRNIKPLPFDFYIPSNNTCIEYDGKQHFEPVNHFGGGDTFTKIKRNDSIKNTYCKTNGIKLIRIKYNQDVIDVLTENNSLI